MYEDYSWKERRRTGHPTAATLYPLFFGIATPAQAKDVATVVERRLLAQEIAERWIYENIEVFRATGRLVEEYDVSGDDAARGGEYPLQDGFGWTNGVLRRLLALSPAAEELPAAAQGGMR